jgi:transcriptional regulator with XRE-family HTH domain
MTLGQKIRYHRRKNHLTQEELAEKVGMSKIAICLYEQDKREPRFFTAICLADALGVSLDYLAGKENGE